MRPCLIHSRTFVASVLVAFLLLSLADLYLTWSLLAPQGDTALESNPLARFVYEVAGWPGMTAYKLSLMLVIGLVVLVVTRRRPRAGELVLTFGCGTQAAVVMSSVFLWCSIAKPETEYSAPVLVFTESRTKLDCFPPDGMLLLVQRPIQEDLGLSTSQVSDILGADRNVRAMRLRLTSADTEDLRGLVGQIEHLEYSVPEKLSCRQKHRLLQISWQHRGALAFGDWEVSTRLDLTREQCQAVLPLLKEARDLARSEPTRRRDITEGALHSADKVARIKTQLVELLTLEQRSRWEQITGKAFHFEQCLGFRTVDQPNHVVD